MNLDGKTDMKYCMQGSHEVPKDEMTEVRANGVKRRMCEKCAERWHDDKKKRLKEHSDRVSLKGG